MAGPYLTETGTYLDFDLDDAIERELPYPGQQPREPRPIRPEAQDAFVRRNSPLDWMEDPGVADDIGDIRRLMRNPKDKFIREHFNKSGTIGKTDQILKALRGVSPDMPFTDLNRLIRERMGFERYDPALSNAQTEAESREGDPGGYMKSVNPDRRDRQMLQSYPQRPAAPMRANPGPTDEELLEMITQGMAQ
jgi:hypothetical protein